MADVKKIIEWLRLAEAATQDQLDRENEDLAFQDPGGAWDADAKKGRAETTFTNRAGTFKIPPRPMITVSTLEEPVALVTGQFAKASLGVQIHPLDDAANDDTAEMLQGLYRRIEVDSRASLARYWAYDRAVKAGRGCYRVFIVPDTDSDVPGDMEIAITRILYQSAAYADPFAQQPDDSDAQWWIILEDMPLAKFNRIYPGKRVERMSDSELVSEGANAPGWIGGDTPESRTIRVAEVFYLEHDEKTDTHTNWKGERSSVSQTTSLVKHCTVNAFETLEEETWPGKYLPVIRTIGRELQPYDTGDGMTRQWFGMIAPAKGGARLTNYAASGAIEMAALEPKAPWQGEEGTDEGYEEEYRLSNVRNIPFLHHTGKNLRGEKAEAPKRVQVDVSRMGPNMELLRMGKEFVQTATAIHPPALGIDTPAHRSGRAIEALQGQSLESNSPYLVNFAQMSMTQEARVVLDLIPHVYDRPGRIARLLGNDGKSQRVMLNQPFMPGQNGALQKLDPNDPATMQNVNDPKHPAKFYDLNKGRYGVSVTIGKSYTDKMQEGSSEMGQLLQADPALMPILGPEYFKYRGEPWADEAAEILKKVRAHTMPFLAEKTDQPDPAMLTQKVQEQGQVIQQMGKALETEQAKHQAQVEIEKAKLAAEVQIEATKQQHAIELQRMKDATAIRMKEIDALIKGVQIDHEHEADALARQHEAAESEKARTHDVGMSAAESQQAAQQADADRAHDVGMGAQGHAQTLEQGDQAHAQNLEVQEAQAEAEPEAAV